VGLKTALALARCGYGDQLLDAISNPSTQPLPTFLSDWRASIREELRTNSHGYLSSRSPALANAIPDSFPDLEIVYAYTSPVTNPPSETFHFAPDRKPDLQALMQFSRRHFNWAKTMGSLLHRFETLIWPGLIASQLRLQAIETASGQASSLGVPESSAAGDKDSYLRSDIRPVIYQISKSRFLNTEHSRPEFLIEFVVTDLLEVMRKVFNSMDSESAHEKIQHSGIYSRWLPAAVVSAAEDGLIKRYEREQKVFRKEKTLDGASPLKLFACTVAAVQLC
jgi:hypothetical protein